MHLSLFRRRVLCCRGRGRAVSRWHKLRKLSCWISQVGQWHGCVHGVQCRSVQQQHRGGHLSGVQCWSVQQQHRGGHVGHLSGAQCRSLQQQHRGGQLSGVQCRSAHQQHRGDHVGHLSSLSCQSSGQHSRDGLPYSWHAVGARKRRRGLQHGVHKRRCGPDLRVGGLLRDHVVGGSFPRQREGRGDLQWVWLYE